MNDLGTEKLLLQKQPLKTGIGIRKGTKGRIEVGMPIIEDLRL